MTTGFFAAAQARFAPLQESARIGEWPVLAAALLVAVGYYAGAKLGLALTFSPHPIAVLWPPNSILLAALLLAPFRWWWILLLAAFPVHMLAELQGGVPLAMVLCWFVSNAAEALIGAACVRALLKRPPAFDSLGNAGIFLLFAVFLAPFLSSFLDAAFVRLIGWGYSDYWQLWRTRFFSNALTALTVVPVIVTWATAGGGAMPAAPGRRAEGMVLLLGLLATTVFAFDVYPIEAAVLPSLLYLPLPFLLWAALRFGPAGSSAAFMIVAFLVIWGAGHGRGPFATGTPIDNALSVQMFLTFVGVSLLVLAAGVQETRNAVLRLRSSEQRLATDRKAAEETLRASDQRFQLVLQATNDVIYDWNIAADDLWWSRNGDAYLGEMSENGPCNFARWAGLLHPDDRERVVTRLKALIDGGSAVCDAEYRLRRTDGTYAYVNGRGFILRDERGKPLRMIGSLMDVSDRKRVEEANQRLAHVSRLAVVGELTASIAHEINQPLGAILSNADAAEILLASKVVPLDELRQIIDDIRKDDIRAGEIIKQMRSLLRRRELAMQPFDLNRAIGDVLHLVSADLARHRVAVDTDFSPLPIVHGDQVHLQQVAINLILNGVDAMADLPPSRRRLGLRTQRSDAGGVEVTVWDSGPGIAPDQAERLFESFFTTKPDGMGLGLAIARSIVEAHGGDIRAATRPEGGASFSFFLPGKAGGRKTLQTRT